jgi:Tol biopolymer transport system component
LDALLLLTYREDGFRLLRLDLSTGARQVLATSARSFDGVLSPRGDVLVYRRLSEMGPSTYHVIELPSGREVYAFRCCGTVYQLPAFTADGSRILYIQPSNRAEGQVLYAVKLDGSDPVVVLEAVNQFLISYPDFALD